MNQSWGKKVKPFQRIVCLIVGSNPTLSAIFSNDFGVGMPEMGLKWG